MSCVYVRRMNGLPSLLRCFLHSNTNIYKIVTVKVESQVSKSLFIYKPQVMQSQS